jgi:hypothetical protein
MLGGSLVTTAWWCPQVGDGGDGYQIWRVAANTSSCGQLTKGAPVWGLGKGLILWYQLKCQVSGLVRWCSIRIYDLTAYLV